MVILSQKKMLVNVFSLLFWINMEGTAVFDDEWGMYVASRK